MPLSKGQSICLFAFAILPLVHGPIFGNQHLPKMGLLAVLIAGILTAGVVRVFCQRKIAIGCSYLACWWALFGLFTIVAAFHCVNGYSALDRLIHWWLLIALYFWASCSDKAFLARCLTMLSASAVIAAAYGLLQSLYLKPIHSYPAHVSSFGNVNFAATFMAAVLPIAMTWEGRLRRFRFVAVAMIALYLLRTGSRGAWIAAGAGLMFYGTLWGVWTRRQISWRKSGITAMGVCLILAMPLVISSWRREIEGRLSSLTDWQHGSVKVRLDVWRGSCEMVRQNFWLGVGTGQFMHHFPYYRSVEEYLLSEGRLVDDPHNTWLLILSECGIITAVLLALIIATTAVRLIRIAQSEVEQKRPAAAFLCSEVALVIAGFFYCPLLSPATAVVLPLISGWSDRSSAISHPLTRILKGLLIIASLLAIFALSSIPRRLVADVLAMQGQTALKSSKALAATEALRKAVAWYPDGIYCVELGRALLATGNYSCAAEVFEDAGTPALEALYVNLACCYLKMGQQDRAEELLQKASSYFPASFTVAYNLAKLFLESHREVRAIHLLTTVASRVTQYSRDFNYHLLLGRSYHGLKEYRQALICYEAAANLNPTLVQNFEYVFRLARCHEGLKDYQEALKCYTIAADIEPMQILPYMRIALSIPCAAEGDTLYEKFTRAGLLNERPQDARDYLHWGIYHETKGGLPGLTAALVNYNRARDIEPNNTAPYIYIASVYQKLSLAAPDSREIYLNAAWGVLEELEKMKCQPLGPLVAFYKGRTLECFQSPDRNALRYYHKAAESSSLKPLAYLHIAQIHLALREEKIAREYLQQSCAWENNDPEELEHQEFLRILTTHDLFHEFFRGK